MQKYGKWILTVVTVLWCAVIWQFSLDTGEASASTSGQVRDLCNGVLQSMGINAKITGQTVRKLAHFFEFFLLGCLGAACFLLHGFRHWQLLAGLVFLPVAVIDECIQIFVPDRGPHILDVLLDCAGAVCGVLALAALVALIKYIKNKREEKNSKTT